MLTQDPLWHRRRKTMVTNDFGNLVTDFPTTVIWPKFLFILNKYQYLMGRLPWKDIHALQIFVALQAFLWSQPQIKDIKNKWSDFHDWQTSQSFWCMFNTTGSGITTSRSTWSSLHVLLNRILKHIHMTIYNMTIHNSSLLAGYSGTLKPKGN